MAGFYKCLTSVTSRNPDCFLHEWIAGTLPAITDHLKMAKEIAAKLK
jgi:hypothetical protein